MPATFDFNVNASDHASGLFPTADGENSRGGTSSMMKTVGGGGAAVPLLHRAALLNDARACARLIREGVDVHMADESGRTG